MWRLLRDQVERSWRQILVLAAVAAVAALLGSSLGPLRVQPAGDPGRLFARLFIATIPVFMAASLGFLSTLINSRFRHAAVVRILPLRRDQLARALALGAGMPGLIIGALVCALVILLHIGLGLGGFDRTLFDRLAPTVLACTLGAAMSVVSSCYLAVTGGLKNHQGVHWLSWLSDRSSALLLRVVVGGDQTRSACGGVSAGRVDCRRRCWFVRAAVSQTPRDVRAASVGVASLQPRCTGEPFAAGRAECEPHPALFSGINLRVRISLSSESRLSDGDCCAPAS